MCLRGTQQKRFWSESTSYAYCMLIHQFNSHSTNNNTLFLSATEDAGVAYPIHTHPITIHLAITIIVQATDIAIFVCFVNITDKNIKPNNQFKYNKLETKHSLNL